MCESMDMVSHGLEDPAADLIFTLRAIAHDLALALDP
jgi:hypothetical protein